MEIFANVVLALSNHQDRIVIYDPTMGASFWFFQIAKALGRDVTTVLKTEEDCDVMEGLQFDSNLMMLR